MLSEDLSESAELPQELLRNRESEILEQYIDMYVRQFVEGMDQTFIDEHNSSSSGHSEQLVAQKR